MTPVEIWPAKPICPLASTTDNKKNMLFEQSFSDNLNNRIFSRQCGFFFLCYLGEENPSDSEFGREVNNILSKIHTSRIELGISV